MGEKGKVWTTPFSPERGESAPGIRSTSFDTLCGSVRQDAGGTGAQVSVAAARVLSEVRRGTGLGARICNSLL